MKTALKISLGVLVLLTMKLDADADGFYSPLSYRKDDPFLFCTKGQDPQKNPAPCWRPIPPFTGEYMMMPYCKPPSYPYGKDWTQDDIKSLQEYIVVCPNAESSGAWEGGGMPETSPDSWH